MESNSNGRLRSVSPIFPEYSLDYYWYYTVTVSNYCYIAVAVCRLIFKLSTMTWLNKFCFGSLYTVKRCFNEAKQDKGILSYNSLMSFANLRASALFRRRQEGRYIDTLSYVCVFDVSHSYAWHENKIMARHKGSFFKWLCRNLRKWILGPQGKRFYASPELKWLLTSKNQYRWYLLRALSNSIISTDHEVSWN